MRRRGLMGVLVRLRLFGTGFDPFELAGDSTEEEIEEITVYVVKCTQDDYSYLSSTWVRGAKCPMCGSPMETSVSE